TGAIGLPVTTTTTVNTSQATIIYGTPATFTILVTATSGSTPPAGSVEVFDNATHDLGAAVFSFSSALSSTWVLTTGPTDLFANSSAHAITANYSGSGFFQNSSNTLVGGLTVNPKGLTITAVASTKTYDATLSSAVIPAVSGLV